MMKCNAGICDKKRQVFSLVPENAVIPIECEIGKLRSLFAYFQYRAPNIDSIHSPLLAADKHGAVLEQIIATHNTKAGG